MVNLFMRAIRRAGIPIVYSKGFHPKPRLRFADALPLGHESRCEELWMTASGALSCPDLQERLNAQLPEGLAVLRCGAVAGDKERQTPEVITYRVVLSDDRFHPDELERFRQKDAVVITRTGRKGKNREINLHRVVDRIVLSSEDTLEISLRPAADAVLRPAEVLQNIFSLTAGQLSRARIIKTAAR
jgi:radical SAM-linked protein